MAHETTVFILHYPIKGPMDFFSSSGFFKLKKQQQEKGHKGKNHYKLNLGIEVGFIFGNENLKSHHIGNSPCKSQS